MKRVHLIGLESIETRYTKEWKVELPKILSEYFEVVDDYYGEELDTSASTGGFLNWTSTNFFKSSQVMKIATAFQEGKVRNGDIFLFADFWNPGILQLKYMAQMTGVDIKIVGLAHAGYYDPWDQLAQKCSGEWIKNTEKALAEACDVIIFATEFHYKLFRKTHNEGRAVVCGLPFDYVQYQGDDLEKCDTVLFTQRNAPEKQPELFLMLERTFNEIYPNNLVSFVNVQSLNLNKDEYWDFLRKSKLVISFALQETLGITPFEALSADCDILVPDRLSYSEMYCDDFKYDSESSINDLARNVHSKLINFYYHKQSRRLEFSRVKSRFFSSKKLIDVMMGL